MAYMLLVGIAYLALRVEWWSEEAVRVVPVFYRVRLFAGYICSFISCLVQASLYLRGVIYKFLFGFVSAFLEISAICLLKLFVICNDRLPVQKVLQKDKWRLRGRYIFLIDKKNCF